MGNMSKTIKNKKVIQDIKEYLKYYSEIDYILFTIGITTGYRSEDLVDLKIRDIQKALREKEFCIIEKKREKNHRTKGLKGNPKPRIVSVQPYVSKIIKEYIRGKASCDYAFPSQEGGHVTVDSYVEILRKVCKYFNLDNIGAHTPRKIYAYKLYIDSGKNIELVRQDLGHSTTLITECYLGLDRDAIDEYSKKLNDFLK